MTNFTGSAIAVLMLVVLAVPVPASGLTVRLAASHVSPQLLGTTITFTAGATSSTTNPLSYRFEVAPPGSFVFSLVRDFSTVRALNWTPMSVEGVYRIRVTARDYLAGETVEQTRSFELSSRLVANRAVVNSTDHPLVALFSAPTCPNGSSMRAAFQKDGALATNYTDWKPCRPGSMNFHVAGMLPETLYTMNYEVMIGRLVIPGPEWLPFTTGALPDNLPVPTQSVPVPPTLQSDLASGILLTGYVPMPGLAGPFPASIPLATNLTGTIMWYYPMFTQLTRPVAGGNMLMIMSGFGTGTGIWGDAVMQQVIREVDLAGNTVRETNADRITEQLVERGTDPIGRFHHDVVRLANGNTIVFGDVQRIFPAGTQGTALPTNILGVMIVVLDQNWQVIWHWNAFDHTNAGELDINREALRGEICFAGQLGCPPVLLAPVARDWLHANSVQYVSSDGNLLVSLRNQDWLIKIAYEDGSGDGRVLWRMGKDGDFAILSVDPYSWFSGQHEAALESDGTTLTVFDNGTSRIMENPGANSRGQAFQVNEPSRVVAPLLNADLGVYGIMLGSAQRLGNGNYSFNSGFSGPLSAVFQQSIEVTPDGSVVHVFHGESQSYRSWRLKDLYTPPGS